MLDFDTWWKDAEIGYMARQSQIEEIIKRLAANSSQCNDFNFQCQIYDEVGFDSDTLTESEVEYITQSIEKRLK